MRNHSREELANLSLEGEFVSDFDEYISSRDVFEYCFNSFN